MKLTFTSCVAALGLLGFIGQAHADFVTNLNETNVSGFPNGTAMGTITVRDETGTDALTGFVGNYVQVTVQLMTGTQFDFVDTGGGAPFTFNSDKTIASAAVGVNNSNFVWQTPGPVLNNPYGDFTNGFALKATGGAGSQEPPFIFTLDGLSSSDLLFTSTAPTPGSNKNFGGGTAYFAADLLCDDASGCGSDGNTGTVAGDNETGIPLLTQPIPEVSTWVMMILGFFGLGFVAYRRHGRSGKLAFRAG